MRLPGHALATHGLLSAHLQCCLYCAAGVSDVWCAYIVMFAWRPRLQLGQRSYRNWLYSAWMHRHVFKVRSVAAAVAAAVVQRLCSAAAIPTFQGLAAGS